jgi:hypothetical protein
MLREEGKGGKVAVEGQRTGRERVGAAGGRRERGARGVSGGIGFMPVGWVAPRRVPQEKRSGGGSDCGGRE